MCEWRLYSYVKLRNSVYRLTIGIRNKELNDHEARIEALDTGQKFINQNYLGGVSSPTQRLMSPEAINVPVCPI